MAFTANHVVSAILLALLSLDFTDAQIGVCYGRNGDGLPSPCQVVALYKRNNIQRMRIFDTDPPTLEALRGSNIELTVGIVNVDLEKYAACQANADTWVRDNIKKYPDVRFRYIVVGNEVSPIRGDTSRYVPFVLRAMQNVYNAVSAAGLSIRVTTNIDSGVLDNSSFPPRNGVFRSNVAPYLNPIVQFLARTGAPIFASIYPYFSYKNNPEQIGLQYALLQPGNAVTMPDGTVYENLFYALYDTVYAALQKSVASSSEMRDAGGPPQPIGGESGWSTSGGGKVVSGWSTSGGGKGVIHQNNAANVDNARTYINNLVQVVKKGTPLRSGQPIETYIFAMFDENRKPGDEEEKHFGMFRPSGQPKYPVNFN